MTMGVKPVSEYKRQYKWHEIAEPEPMAGCPSFKEIKVAEPLLQANQRPNLELASKEEMPEVLRTFGSPSKDLHIKREPSFSHKKRVPGASPERIQVSNRSLAKKAGLSNGNINSARYQSEYSTKFSPSKKSVPRPSSPVQNSKINFVDSKTNLPIGKKPVDKKVQSEYSSRFVDPTTELKYVRELYKEEVRRKRLELEKAEKELNEKKKKKKPPTVLNEQVVAKLAPEKTEKETEKAEEKRAEPVKDPKPPASPVPEKKVKLKIVSPIKGVPKVKGSYDLIAPPAATKWHWQSEYKSKFESPVKESGGSVSAYGRRNHPYKSPTGDRVADLIRTEASAVLPTELDTPVNWFSEVLELRKMAHEFKARSHGSHFSPNKMATLTFSKARLRECPSVLSPPGSAESFKVIPTEKPSAPKDPPLPVAVPATENPKPETDLKVTDLEEEIPNIDNLVIKTQSLMDTVSPVTSPKKPKPKSPSSKSASPRSSEGKVKVVAEKEESVCSTPRTADRSFSLFGGRVPTPKLKNQGSRHHFDRTTHKSKTQSTPRAPEMETAVLAGRVATPTLVEKGGSRHHLDHTTPAPPKSHKPTMSTQPFFPILSDQVKEKLDFSSPSQPEGAGAKNGWSQDLDNSVLSRASSCTSLASATLSKAGQRGPDFWKK